jgi:hypothetical protein
VLSNIGKGGSQVWSFCKCGYYLLPWYFNPPSSILNALLIFNAHTYPIQNDRLTFEYGFHAHESSLVNTIKCS